MECVQMEIEVLVNVVPFSSIPELGTFLLIGADRRLGGRVYQKWDWRNCNAFPEGSAEGLPNDGWLSLNDGELVFQLS